MTHNRTNNKDCPLNKKIVSIPTFNLENSPPINNEINSFQLEQTVEAASELIITEQG